MLGPLLCNYLFGFPVQRSAYLLSATLDRDCVLKHELACLLGQLTCTSHHLPYAACLPFSRPHLRYHPTECCTSQPQPRMTLAGGTRLCQHIEGGHTPLSSPVVIALVRTLYLSVSSNTYCLEHHTCQSTPMPVADALYGPSCMPSQPLLPQLRSALTPRSSRSLQQSSSFYLGTLPLLHEQCSGVECGTPARSFSR